MKLAGVLVVVILALIGLFLVFEVVSSRPVVQLSLLNDQSFNLPTQWECTWCQREKTVSVEWTYSDNDVVWLSDFVLEKRLLDHINFKEIIWSDGKTYDALALVIIDYESPLLAELYFHLNDPQGIYRERFWNFEYDRENATPTDWKFSNTSADNELVRCGNGTQEMCSGWFYQARYGQYYLFIHFYRTLDYETFERFVRAITDELVNILQ